MVSEWSSIWVSILRLFLFFFFYSYGEINDKWMRRHRRCNDHSCGLCNSNGDYIVWIVEVRVNWMRMRIEINERRKRRWCFGNFQSFLLIQKVQHVIQHAKARKNSFSITEVQPQASDGAYHLYTLLILITKHKIHCIQRKHKHCLKYKRTQWNHYGSCTWHKYSLGFSSTINIFIFVF